MQNDTQTRTEYGHRITWADGHVEYERDSDRRDADLAAARVTHGGASEATAEVVTRTVTVSPWTPLGGQRP